MNQTRLMELVVGLFICLGLAAIFLLTLQVSTQNDLRRESTYSVQARFDNVGSHCLSAIDCSARRWRV